MEASSIVNEPRNAEPSCARIKGETQEVCRKIISDYCQISSNVGQYLERRTGNIPRALFKGTRGFGLPGAGSGADFTVHQDLHHR